MGLGKSLVAIVGSTGIGKSALAIKLAERFDGEIVNADSRQVYRGMDIGTAKPTLEEQERIPHKLIDICDPDEVFNLAFYLEQSTAAINEIQARGKLPLLVGGTGLYIWGLLEGLSIPRVPPNATFRSELQARAESQGMSSLHCELRQVDPHSANRIDPRNVRRVIRALEVYHATGIPFSKAQLRTPPDFPVFVLGLTMERERLNSLLERRVDTMLGKGWVEEVKLLLERGYFSSLPSFSTLGYRDVADHISGSLSWEEATKRIKILHKRFSRRQNAWFRPNDTRIHWINAASAAFTKAELLVNNFLGTSSRL